jgi:hypothetical protein
MKKLFFILSLAGLLAAQNPNTAKFPTAIATDQDLLAARDRAASTLTANITELTTAIPVASGALFLNYTSVTIENEQILVCSVAANTLNVCGGGRGFSATTATSHPTGAAVRANITAWHHNQLAAETKAIETALGVNLANVASSLTFNSPLSRSVNTVSCPTCLVNTGSYADPAWVTSLSGAKISGSVPTATALAADPTACPANQWVIDLAANGGLTCSQPASTNLTDSAGLVRGAASLTTDHKVVSVSTTDGTLEEIPNQTANYVYAGPTVAPAAAPAFRALVSADIPNNAADTSGNAGTATALAADPTDCAANQYASSIAASGNLGCAQVAYSQVSGTPAAVTGGTCTNQVATAIAGGSAAPTCITVTSAYTSGTFPATAHGLLSATHGDSTVGAVVRGDIITGQGVSPAWTRLGLGTSGKYPKSDGTDLVYSTGAASGIGACGANTWASTLNADAAPTCTQPASTNLSDSAGLVRGAGSLTTVGQFPYISAAGTLGESSALQRYMSSGGNEVIQVYNTVANNVTFLKVRLGSGQGANAPFYIVNNADTDTLGGMASNGAWFTTNQTGHNYFNAIVNPARWVTQLASAETGADAGSDFYFYRYADGGGYLDAPLWIKRSTGIATFSQTISGSISGNASTATALAADPANCAAGSVAAGVTAAGVAEGCVAATNLNTASAIVQRDGSGNFSAGTITAALTGNASTATALAADPPACPANQWVIDLAANGGLSCSQPAFSNISGTAGTAQGGTGADLSGCTSESVFYAGAGGVLNCDGRHTWTTATSVQGLARNSADIFGPAVQFRKRGTTGTPSGSVSANDEIGAYNFLGWDGAIYGSGTYFSGFAKENFTPTAWGGRFTIYTTTTGTTTSLPRLSIEDTETKFYTGNVGIGKTPTTKLDVDGTTTSTLFVGPLTGNAGTATALAADPTDCGAGEYANAIAANGNLTCSTPAGGTASRASLDIAFASAIYDGNCAQNTAGWAAVAAGDVLTVGWPGALNTGLLAAMFAPVNGTVAVRLCNYSGASVTPGTLTYKVELRTYSLTGSSTIDFGAIYDGACVSNTFALAGAVAGDHLAAGWPNTLETGLIGTMFVSAADIVQIRLCNSSGATLDPASHLYKASISS